MISSLLCVKIMVKGILKMNKRNNILKLTLSALFLALAYVMPFLTGQIPTFGTMLCPMHIPVLLCGFICGWPWGLVVGLVAPLLRSLTLGAPVLFPMAICMSFELAAYGAASGVLHNAFPRKRPYIYCSLLISMIIGRLVWGAAMLVFLGITSSSFTISAFIAGAIANSIPGIIIQIVLIPIIVMLLENPKILKWRREND